VKVKTPKQGRRFARALRIEAEASDDQRIARVDLYVDGRLVDRDTRAPYQETWTVPKRLSYGSHSVTARAYDSAGQSGAHSVGVTRVRAVKVGEHKKHTRSKHRKHRKHRRGR
jgi:hypothetical protein